VSPVREPAEIQEKIEMLSQQPHGGLINVPDGFSSSHKALFVELTDRYRLPAIYPFREFTDAGGLISYGNDLVDNARQAASYVDRILRGQRPSDLPVVQPSKFELVINLKTARSLGLQVPMHLQQLADEVIE
jgi:putative ABC transport system substrate-binding protein